MQDLMMRTAATGAPLRRPGGPLAASSGGRWAPGWNERSHPGRQDIPVLLCRDTVMLESAQRLRYAVCREAGLDSPFADHDKQIITDALDAFGYTLVALDGAETIGTLRVNLPSEGALGEVEERHAMAASAYHPHATALCTKFAVKNSSQGGLASIVLLAAVARLGERFQIQECYIGAPPSLVPFYQAIGFAIAGPLFLDPENGPSWPMVIDLEEHSDRLGDERQMMEAARITRAAFDRPM